MFASYFFCFFATQLQSFMLNLIPWAQEAQKLAEVQLLIHRAQVEDLGTGDHSTLACIPAEAVGKSQAIAKEDGIVAGIEVAEMIFKLVEPSCTFDRKAQDGDSVRAGDVLFVVEATVHTLLSYERTMLNIIQRMSGIATLTRRLTELIKNFDTRLLDTRKTTPGLRFFEKWAVAIGGGFNHRMGLYDMVMLKDNHIDFAGGIAQAVARTKKYLKNNRLDLKIEVETRNLDEVHQAIEAEVDRIMLDNFSPSLIREALQLIQGRCETEASGGINEKNLKDYAATGVQYISIGALTHSVKSMDISFKALD